ncbi:hypothetical protein STBA_54880 [Streptomyces sp. MP131-18]|nr:hypothetical protein STBA_54880 [Streptomyces sp. MP131-18]
MSPAGTLACGKSPHRVHIPTARVIAAAARPRSSDARDPAREAARKQLSALTERELATARAIADGLGKGNPAVADRVRIALLFHGVPSITCIRGCRPP